MVYIDMDDNSYVTVYPFIYTRCCTCLHNRMWLTINSLLFCQTTPCLDQPCQVHFILSILVVTVALQTPSSVLEADTTVTICVDLTNVPGEGLEVDVEVYLAATNGTASECCNNNVL